MNFFGASPQVLPLPCDSSQFRRAPISITTSESFSTLALRVRVRQKTLGHAHRQEGNSAFFDQSTDLIISLRISRTLAEDNQRPLGAFEHIKRAFDRIRSWDLRGRRVNHLYERLLSGLCRHHLTEQFGRQIEIDATRTARDRGADRTRYADADIGGMQHAEGRLAE